MMERRIQNEELLRTLENALCDLLRKISQKREEYKRLIAAIRARTKEHEKQEERILESKQAYEANEASAKEKKDEKMKLSKKIQKLEAKVTKLKEKTRVYAEDNDEAHRFGVRSGIKRKNEIIRSAREEAQEITNTAEEAAQEIINKAELKADDIGAEIIKEAQKEAQKIIEKARKTADQITSETNHLRRDTDDDKDKKREKARGFKSSQERRMEYANRYQSIKELVEKIYQCEEGAHGIQFLIYNLICIEEILLLILLH